MRPPTIATWVLRRFAPGNQALVGDLIEEYRQGRSRSWYWRQVIVAIVVGSYRESLDHRLLAFRAVVIGWAAALLFFGFVGDPLSTAGGKWVWNWTVETGQDTLRSLWWTHLRFLPPTCLGFVVSGWMVTRFHRLSTVLVFIASVIAVLGCSSIGLWLWARPVAVPQTLFFVIVTALPFYWLIGFILIPLSIMLGSLWSAPRGGRLA